MAVASAPPASLPPLFGGRTLARELTVEEILRVPISREEEAVVERLATENRQSREQVLVNRYLWATEFAPALKAAESMPDVELQEEEEFVGQRGPRTRESVLEQLESSSMLSEPPRERKSRGGAAAADPSWEEILAMKRSREDEEAIQRNMDMDGINREQAIVNRWVFQNRILPIWLEEAAKADALSSDVLSSSDVSVSLDKQIERTVHKEREWQAVRWREEEEEEKKRKSAPHEESVLRQLKEWTDKQGSRREPSRADLSMTTAGGSRMLQRSAPAAHKLAATSATAPRVKSSGGGGAQRDLMDNPVLSKMRGVNVWTDRRSFILQQMKKNQPVTHDIVRALVYWWMHDNPMLPLHTHVTKDVKVDGHPGEWVIQQIVLVASGSTQDQAPSRELRRLYCTNLGMAYGMFVRGDNRMLQAVFAPDALQNWQSASRLQSTSSSAACAPCGQK